jgi:serine/threonine-protein kinase RsbT
MSEIIPIRSSNDVIVVRQIVRSRAAELSFSLIDQTKMVTAASELARNTLDYGGGGSASIDIIDLNERKGLQITFEDHGPGIADVDKALTDGYTTGDGLGLGLSGSRRLVNEFSIESHVGIGTRVTITRWK